MHLAWNNRNSRKQYCLYIKTKTYQFSSKNPSATKNSSKSNVYYMVVASDKRGSLDLVGSLGEGKF